ncbi:ABC transporter substrate-binding protein [Filobacillus milosensis]|uniref:ABC transporter substrate-binding protein n=1 Tax=Filobacillus milosensis TaxID=94137 RepID=A0A4Y8IL86_9BACI|nr:ABC transporter substrate-binding protein [Filobacillus milosensis]TFB22069.1 ABC transporter substrate-binding protein [Filobacillus milosensis]
MKKLLNLLMMSTMLLIVAACGTSTDAESESNGASGSEESQFTVGITQIVEHPSLNRATEGFKKALTDAGLNVEFEKEVAQGDNNNNQMIAQKFVSDEVDLIFANSTPSAQSALNETSEIPIVFTSVTDPVGAGLVESMDEPGGNVTGTADMHPDTLPKTLDLIKDLKAASIGLIYNAGEQNSVSQIEAVKELANEKGLGTEEATVSSSSEVKQAAESLVGKADAFLVITDNTVVSALETVLMVGQNEQMPVVVSEHDSVKRGGFAAYGFDYFDIGYEAGEKAVQILKDGKSPSEIPAQFPQNLTLQINKEAAEKMGVELTDELKEKATIVTTEKDE